MLIGVPKEIKNREHRVGVTPEGVRRLQQAGHQVLVQSAAGDGCGFDDAAYSEAGARIVAEAGQAWAAELVVKVKEPLPAEYAFLRDDLTLFTYLHLAAYPQLAGELVRRGVFSIGYETVQNDAGALPLLAPMSHVAGRLAAQMGAHYLQAENGSPFAGSGKLLGGVDNVPPGEVLVIGAGNAGLHAAASAAGLGARVRVLDNIAARVASLQTGLPERVSVSLLEPAKLEALLAATDLLIGAALVPGDTAPHLFTSGMIGAMRPGSVFVDISIDQGGISETSRATTYEQPVYLEQGVIHCCLPNLPAATPQTSTRALTAATLPYIEKLAGLGIEAAVSSDAALSRGVNTRAGRLEHAGVIHALGDRPA